MKILLTGSAGFIGTHIAGHAEAAGHEVVKVDDFLPMAHGDDPSVPSGTHRLDLRHEPLDALLDGVDVVCHQAAMVGNGVDARKRCRRIFVTSYGRRGGATIGSFALRASLSSARARSANSSGKNHFATTDASTHIIPVGGCARPAPR